MEAMPEGDAVVYCQGAFGTTNGKTAHGLVRRTRRYRLAAVIDSAWAGRDAGEVLDGRPAGIELVADLEQALAAGRRRGLSPSHFVIGLAPDGGRLGPEHRPAVVQALQAGLHVDSGLHDFLGDDPELARLAAAHGVRIRDVRRPPERAGLHFFDGRIEQVGSFRVALLGTDSAVGKRTTAWLLVDALEAAGLSAELIGTGQTAWMQGVRYGVILDSLINDFVTGEIEFAVWQAWQEQHPQVMVLEGQGSLLNPAYPGGYELLAAGRPDVIVLQHAPARRHYDGFPAYRLDPLARQIQAVELVSGRPVVAVAVNHEGLDPDGLARALAAIEAEVGRPALDPLADGGASLAAVVERAQKRGRRP